MGEIQLQGSRSSVRVRLPEADSFEQLMERLGQRLADAPPLTGKAVTVDAGRRQLSADELRALEAVFLERCGATLLQVVDGQSRSAGRSATVAGARTRETPPGEPAALSEGVAAQTGLPPRSREETPVSKGGEAGGDRAAPQPLRPPAQPLQLDASGDTLLIRRTLRSGQRVRFNGNVVVLGDVNPGAEIVASGDIVIMGTLRGVAHAGATGGEQAVVAAFRLQPTQLRIGAVIGRSPDGGAVRPDAPEVARLRGGVVVIERYLPAVADLADWQANGG